MPGCSVASVMSDPVRPCDCSRQAPPSTGFSRQEHWTGLPCPPLGDLPTPGMELVSPVLQGHSLLTEPPEKPRKLRAVVKSLTFTFSRIHTCSSLSSLQRSSQKTLYQEENLKKKKTFCVYSHRKGFTLLSHGFLSFIPQVRTEHSTSAR